MAKNLLVLPLELKEKTDKNHKQIIDKIISEYEVFYIESSLSYSSFLKYISENKFETVVYAFPDVIKDYKNLRAFKALNLKSKLVLLFPQIANLKILKTLDKDIYDTVYQLVKKSSDMEVSNCQLADAVVLSSVEDKKLLSGELADVAVYTGEEIIKSNISFKEKSKYLVSIIMLTYNQLEDTKICVESLFKHTADVNFELIFVDNGSTKDNTKAYLESLKAEHTNIKTIYNTENLGFACANNQGIEISEGEYVLLLNNDVILSDGWLDRMLLVLRSDKNTGLVAPCTNHASGKQVVVFEVEPEEDELIQNFAKTTLLQNAGTWFKVERVIGFCMLIKREVLFKVGVLDEMFGPGGYEDYDYCMRIRQAGYDIAIAADTFIFHIGGKGYSSNNMNYNELRARNIELLIDKWTRQSIKIMEKIPNGM